MNSVQIYLGGNEIETDKYCGGVFFGLLLKRFKHTFSTIMQPPVSISSNNMQEYHHTGP